VAGEILRGVEALTFDCYGTLIDWDGGILVALRALPSLRSADRRRLVLDREQAELALLDGPFRLYGEILTESLLRAAREQGLEPSAAELDSFRRSMGTWPAFRDSSSALRRLARRFRLAILSNVETSVLRESATHLGAPIDVLVTAEELRSYKPACAHWRAALERLGLPRERVVHVAGSLVHDIRPARSLGWRAIWIDRRGASKREANLRTQADHVLFGLAELAELAGV
jgi:2-haloacid dehalogenase